MNVQTAGFDPRATGWKLEDGQLLTPPPSAAESGSDAGGGGGADVAAPRCVTGKQWGLAAYVGCPPTTRAGGVAQCGLTTRNCTTTGGGGGGKQVWSLNSTGLFFGDQQRVRFD